MPNMSGHNIFSSWHYSLAETMKNMFDLCWKKVILSTGSWWGQTLGCASAYLCEGAVMLNLRWPEELDRAMRMPRRRLLTTVLLVSGGALFLWLLVVRGGLTSNELEQSRHLASEHILHTSSSQSQHQQVFSLSLEILYKTVNRVYMVGRSRFFPKSSI